MQIHLFLNFKINHDLCKHALRQIIIICKLETLIYSQIDKTFYASKIEKHFRLTLIAYIKCCGYDFF